MNSIFEFLNARGPQALATAGQILWQSSLLIAFLLLLDRALQRRLRPGLRYVLWLVVLLKLVLPPSLALPSGVAWWLRAPVATEPARPAPAWIATYETAAPPLSEPVRAFESAPPAPRLSLAGGWLGATVIISAAMFGAISWRWRRFSRHTSRHSGIEPPEWLAALAADAAHAAGVRRRVEIRVVPSPMSPALFGLWHPVILLPQSLVSGLSADRLRAVLIHEFVHLRRGDVWVNCAQTLLQVVYWWHPLLWVANYRIRRIREEAVDESVMIALRGAAEAYAPTLLDVARLSMHRPFASLGLVGILEPRRALRQRLERLIAFQPPKRPGAGPLSLLCALVFGALALPMGQAPAADTQPATTLSPNAPSDGAAETGIEVNTLLQQAKKFYDLGKLDEAETQFIRVLQQDPRSQAAYYYLDLIKEAKSAQPRPGIRNVTSRRQRILARLDTLQVQKVDFENTTLANVLNWLTTESRRLDPAGGGIPFIMNPPPRRQDETVALEDVRVRLAQPLSNLRLVDVLEVIVKVADKPLKYSIEDFGVVFSFRHTETPPLHTRIFKVEPGSFGAHLRALTGKDDMAEALRKFLADLNVNLAPPKNIYCNDSEGTIIVRGAPQDLEMIETAINVIRMTPPQVNVKAVFLLLPEEEESAFWKKRTAVTTASGVRTAELSNSEAQQQLREWQSGNAASLLSEPSVTTLSGRQCQMQYIEQTTSRDGIEVTNEPPAGCTLDVLPVVTDDKLGIKLVMTATIIERLGLDDPAVPGAQPSRRYRLHDYAVTAAVPNGRTLVFSREDDAANPWPGIPGYEKKRALIMVTPTIIKTAARARTNNLNTIPRLWYPTDPPRPAK